MPKLNPLIFVGVIFLIIGVVFTLVGLGVRRESSRLESLPLLTAAEISASNDGLVAGVDARIAERNDLQYEGLVAYVREEYRGEKCSTTDDDCEAVWAVDERVTPPLWLDAPDGRFQVINNDYTLQNGPVVRQTDSRLVKNATKVYHGFMIGNPVFVVGHVVAGHDSPAFYADTIYSGDSASHLSDTRMVGIVFFWLGIFFCLIGLVFFGYAFLK
ncbi:MAG: hypothetical protein KDJ52_07805 [Anaerolineae bacterium]|nr:hypothetical protein [Anaerolineae bacterium]